MAARFATVTEEEIRQMNEEAAKSNCLVNTKTTILLSIGACWFRNFFVSATRLGKYQSLVTYTSGDSC